MSTTTHHDADMCCVCICCPGLLSIGMYSLQAGPLGCSSPILMAATGLPQWCSVTLHVEPLLCGVTAVGEHLLWDISREGLPLLELIRTKDPRLKQIRLFWKERGSCTTDMAYHQMAPMLTSALDKCQLNKTKVRLVLRVPAAFFLGCLCVCLMPVHALT